MDSLNYYIEDTFTEIVSRAKELKGNSGGEFKKGKLFAYYEILSLLLNQAEHFGVSSQLPLSLQNLITEELLG